MRVQFLTTVLFLLGGCSLVREAPETWLIENPDVPVAATGDNYVALSGGSCSGECPVYQIFVFESGRIVFIGKQHTRQLGVVERQTMPGVYYDLQKLIVVRGAFSRRFQIACSAGKPAFAVGAVQGTRVRTGYLDSGCFNQRGDLDAIRQAFVRVADASALIK